jgi:transcriptional regulator with XRE-family HTH domain
MKMTIRQRRIKKGWSQLQLAEFAGVSLRTIQRLEKGRSPTVETLKSLAAVFEIDFNELVDDRDQGEIDESKLSHDEAEELEHIRDVQKFIRDLMIFCALLPIGVVFSMIDTFNSKWFLWSLVGWGSYLKWEAINVFDARDFFGKGWEKKMLEKRLGRKVD